MSGFNEIESNNTSRSIVISCRLDNSILIFEVNSESI